jgi:hypothetical protein
MIIVHLTTVEVMVDAKCSECGRDDRLKWVTFTRTQMRAACRCGHTFVVEITLGDSLNVACDVLERNPFVALGGRKGGL